MSNAVIVADGAFPVHEVPLGYLDKADVIVCCDGSAESLLYSGRVPDAIVGDLDSLSDELKNRFSDRIFAEDNQETNDLTKAVGWCHASGYDNITILGATGKREDHTIGNISLLTEYSRFADVKMITDTGVILPFHKSCSLKTFPGQQVSIFSIDPETEITSAGLRYPLEKRKLRNWWEATLNEAISDTIELKFEGGAVLVFLNF
jgi:thiamine pyrophosphokinase